MERSLMSVVDVARLLSVSTRTVTRLVDTNKIPPPIRVNRAIRFRASDITEWVENGCPDPQVRQHI